VSITHSVLEALASGVPVVTTDVGGIPYIVQHDVTALLVPRDDPEAMAAAALRARRPCAGLPPARRGQEDVQRYSWAVKGELLAAYIAALQYDRRATQSAIGVH
jgi:glycosyltransferase involved in cell wall biosynthesis